MSGKAILPYKVNYIYIYTHKNNHTHTITTIKESSKSSPKLHGRSYSKNLLARICLVLMGIFCVCFNLDFYDATVISSIRNTGSSIVTRKTNPATATSITAPNLSGGKLDPILSKSLRTAVYRVALILLEVDTY